MSSLSSDLTSGGTSRTGRTVFSWPVRAGTDSRPQTQEPAAGRARTEAPWLLLRTAGWLPAVGVALGLSGCWTPPSAHLPKNARPGTLAGPLLVRTVVHSATVQSVVCASRTITLSAPGMPSASFLIGPHVRGWEKLRQGDELEAHVKLDLTLSIPAQADGAPTVAAHPPDARVLVYDPSYRMLTVLYPDGATDTFKLSLHARLKSVAPGAWVAIHPVEALALHAHAASHRLAGICGPGDVNTAIAGVP